MRIQRTPSEILSKVSRESVIQMGRLFRDVKSPINELLVFLGVRDFEANRLIHLRSGHKIRLSSLVDLHRAFWDCWIREPYPVRKTDRIIIDAGANIGCFSIYAAVKAPRATIYAFLTAFA